MHFVQKCQNPARLCINRETAEGQINISFDGFYYWDFLKMERNEKTVSGAHTKDS